MATKRRTKKYRPSPVIMPTLVALQMAPEVGVTVRLAVESFPGGWATTAHWNDLLDCHDMLLLAAKAKKDAGVIGLCKAANTALFNIRQRYFEKKRFGTTADELAALRALADTEEDFWKRTSGHLFAETYHALQKLRKEQGTVKA